MLIRWKVSCVWRLVVFDHPALSHRDNWPKNCRVCYWFVFWLFPDRRLWVIPPETIHPSGRILPISLVPAPVAHFSPRSYLWSNSDKRIVLGAQQFPFTVQFSESTEGDCCIPPPFAVLSLRDVGSAGPFHRRAVGISEISGQSQLHPATSPPFEGL